MINFIKSLFVSKPTVADITASFTTQVEQLETLNKIKRAEVINFDNQLAAMKREQNIAVQEQLRAAKVATRIKGLLAD